jgi:hypothetical protein
VITVDRDHGRLLADFLVPNGTLEEDSAREAVDPTSGYMEQLLDRDRLGNNASLRARDLVLYEQLAAL